jgi:hypothetical protein
MGIVGDGLEIMKLLNMGANADVHEKLGKFIDRANDLQAKVEQLEQTNKELTEKLRIKDGLYQIWGVLFMEGDPYPLCSKCYEVEKKLVHVELPEDRDYANPRCQNCSTYHPKADLRDKLNGPAIKFVL